MKYGQKAKVPHVGAVAYGNLGNLHQVRAKLGQALTLFKQVGARPRGENVEGLLKELIKPKQQLWSPGALPAVREPLLREAGRPDPHLQVLPPGHFSHAAKPRQAGAGFYAKLIFLEGKWTSS